MFANHSFNQLMKCLCVAVFCVTTTSVYGWQDFPTFSDMMRETDLPSSGRTLNQPVRQPESAWPAIVPAKRPASRSGRTGSERIGSERTGSGSGSRIAPWDDQPVRQSRDFNRRSSSPDDRSRIGEGSDFERFQSTGGRQPVGGQPVGQSFSGQSSSGRRPLDTYSKDQGSGYLSNGRWPNDGSADRADNSDLKDPFGNTGRRLSGNGSSDLTTLPPSGSRPPYTSGPRSGQFGVGQSDSGQSGSGQFRSGQFQDRQPAAGSSVPDASGFIYPAGQSRPVSRPQSGGSFQDFGSSRTGFEDFRGSEFGASSDARPRDNSGAGREFHRGLDAEFSSDLPPRSSLTNDLQSEAALEANSSEFDWRTIRVSVGDIILPSNTIFQHTDSVLSIPEETAYLNLIQDIEARKKALVADPVLTKLSVNARQAAWEECFYEFKKARQMAFANGKLRSGSKLAGQHNGFQDPFGGTVEQSSLTTRTTYEILDDIRRYPDHFSGRPIVLYGMFSPESDRTMSRTDGDLDPTTTSVEEEPLEPIVSRSTVHGLVYNSENLLTKATITTGSLTAADTGDLLATVDTSGLTTPRRGVQDIRSSWRNLPPFPVLIKGWVVKKFKGDRPLIYCESMRLLSPEPHRSLLQTHTYDKQRIQAEEKWLYYETLQQMNETRSDMQQELAHQNVVDRIDVLQSEIIDKFKEDALALKARYTKAKMSQVDYEKRLGSLNRQFQMRKRRHQKYRTETENFPTYVDLFQNPQEWQGKVVTLRGHVRHSVTYDADAAMYDGVPLYELWLFTDDSQHTPAVILTPELPANFPMDADVVNQVSVTGCFFKRYVYTGQAERRIAPLILAGRIQWSPTVSHVTSLVKSGDLSPTTPLAVRAKALESRQSGNTALILISLVIIFGLMVLWGRAQREERDRLRLRDRIVDVKEIESGPPPEFASAADEYLNRIR
ncbi:MAG: hypothetical protein ABJZ55_12460 [Fuerstiella sp.]